MPALHHIALGVHDVEEMAEFYSSVFGLKKIQTHKDDQALLRSIWLDMNPGILMIEKSDCSNPDLAPMQLGKGPFLLAFQIEEKEKEKVLTKLRNFNLEIEGQTSYTITSETPKRTASL